MMLPPDPGVLDSLIRERQMQLRNSSPRRSERAGVSLRVRIGHALIVAGTTLSGERVEQPAPRSALQRAA